MGDITNISWTSKTWSPWFGCSKISPACDGCFAAHLMDTRFGRVEWGGPGEGEGTRALSADSSWKKPISWDRQAAKDGTRPTVFPSLCDPFDLAVDQMWFNRFVDLMEATPNLVWLLLTKRIGNVRKLTDPSKGGRMLPNNVAIGSTFANQPEWDRDSRKLRDVADYFEPLFTFSSFEPMLSDIDFDGGWMPDWIIGGGETDQGEHMARPTHPQWARNLRDQCAEAGKPFHWKQNGEWVSVSEVAGPGEHYSFPDGATVRKIGKSKSGRTIDGVEHNAFPAILGRAA